MASIPGDDPNFWDLVSEKVKTRTGEQCVEQYYKDDPKPNKKKSNKINGKILYITYTMYNMLWFLAHKN